MDLKLAGKRVLVTGSTSGIGKAVAEAMIARGANVVVADIDDGAEIAQGMGARYLHVDVSEEDSVAAALRAAVELLGSQLDIVVLNAGVGDVGPRLATTDQDLVDIMVNQVNEKLHEIMVDSKVKSA